ncbi:MAG: hypothetical protein KGJ87_00445 [Planctomycetota bacterium]|nr:hypothetical protein [Planctomycetota bacterium]
MAARSEAEAIHGFLPEAPAFRLGSGSQNQPENPKLLSLGMNGCPERSGGHSWVFT